MIGSYRTPRMTTHKATKLYAAGLAILMAMSGCAVNSPGKRVIRSDSQQRVGVLKFQIVECASGAIVYQGTREVLARDVAIKQTRGLFGEICFDKRIDLDQTFYIELDDCAAKTREDIDGFSLSPGRIGERSSWEWFEADRESRAVKLQESGELTFIPVTLGSTWEVGRIEVKKEVSLRVFGWDPTAVMRNDPSWRIQLKEGSYIEWPSAAKGVAVLHSFPGPGATPQIFGPEQPQKSQISKFEVRD